jgi:hypothetical protein
MADQNPDQNLSSSEDAGPNKDAPSSENTGPGQNQTSVNDENVTTDENATPEKKYIPATKEDHFENDKPKEGFKFYKKNESGGVDDPPVEVTDPLIAEVETYMVEAPDTDNTEGGGDGDGDVVDQKQRQKDFAKSIIATVMSSPGNNTNLDALEQAVKDAKKDGTAGGRRRTKRKDRKGSRKSRKGAKKGAKKSRKGAKKSQNGGRRSSKNRRKHSHRRKH